jgi:hypothetical protein
MPFTSAEAALMAELRAVPLSYGKIAQRLGCSEYKVFTFLNPRPVKPRPKKPPPAKQSTGGITRTPTIAVHHSVPITRPVTSTERNSRQLTKPEMERDLAEAWANTARMRA